MTGTIPNLVLHLPQAKRAGEPRDMDTLFHSRLTKIENAITDLGSEVQMAVNEVLEGERGGALFSSPRQPIMQATLAVGNLCDCDWMPVDVVQP